MDVNLDFHEEKRIGYTSPPLNWNPGYIPAYNSDSLKIKI